jgi:hypothetical protein
VPNFRALRKSLVTFSVVLCCDASLGLWSLPTFAEESSSTPQPFACEIRYHFREHLRDVKPGEKSVSAPSFGREALPASRVTISNGIAERIVDGRVPHLPYHFLVKICRAGDGENGTLEVDLVDSSDKPLAGFPQVMPNPLTRTGDSSRKAFELPIAKRLRKKIKKTFLAPKQFLTHVDLIVGMDDDFLSADFPK